MDWIGTQKLTSFWGSYCHKSHTHRYQKNCRQKTSKLKLHSIWNMEFQNPRHNIILNSIIPMISSHSRTSDFKTTNSSTNSRTKKDNKRQSLNSYTVLCLRTTIHSLHMSDNSRSRSTCFLAFTSQIPQLGWLQLERSPSHFVPLPT
jgi:hypothetical protein